MDYMNTARELYARLDSLNELDVNDVCLAIGASFNVIDDEEGTASIEVNGADLMELTVRPDEEDGGVDVFFTLYENDENDIARPIGDGGVFVTGLDSLASALSVVHSWVK
ncbi:hypothetical protein [Corynebacterium accolens]|uniref:hypothetical protein n=1 Tax=Corynebacterium accolens TaxID=38284 RepID=UPI00266F8319|nr:hypothetical protein [Corynebacterium accolens]WKS54915.1 hypothetical protein NLL31_06700 [Corynebacterium accolens]